jgi:uncharacterized protein YecE (DUF72 family)
VAEVARRPSGTFRAGTSGFAYPDWAPAFYPVGLRAADRLAFYARRLRSCELNNTYYRRPSARLLETWRDAAPEGFRFVVKAQKGATFRLLRGDATALDDTVAWLTADLPALGDRLGAVLLRVPDPMPRDDARLAAILGAWPRTIPLVMEARDPSWHVDETFAALAAAGGSLCATDLDDGPEPDLRRLGGPLYLRLRRAAYDDAGMERWAARLAPFVAAGVDAYAILRHDETGLSGRRAMALQAAVERMVASG